jgi:hypothetical protein
VLQNRVLRREGVVGLEEMAYRGASFLVVIVNYY